MDDKKAMKHPAPKGTGTRKHENNEHHVAYYENLDNITAVVATLKQPNLRFQCWKCRPPMLSHAEI